jgi:formylmethanofuran dehydrogenase subunit E
MKICNYSYKKYLRLVKSFHGSEAPGLIIGGFMVDLALKNFPKGKLFDAICETQVCLPDAVQILTPCTIGNSWLSIVDLGRFAVILYEKYTGIGVRIYFDTDKINTWPEIQCWYLKEKNKNEQDPEMLMAQIMEAGPRLFGIQHVQVDLKKVRRKKIGPVSVCPVCHEAYPTRDGNSCRNCQGDTIYNIYNLI